VYAKTFQSPSTFRLQKNWSDLFAVFLCEVCSKLEYLLNKKKKSKIQTLLD
jgi:hypothetical protein